MVTTRRGWGPGKPGPRCPFRYLCFYQSFEGDATVTSNPEGIDYSAVLKDLEAKKQAIEALIANVRQLLGMGLQTGNLHPGSPGQAPESEDLRDHPFLGMSIGDAAKKYLTIAKHKQTVKEIADALERGGLHHVSANFPATVATMISRYAKTDPEVISVGRSEWALASWYGNRRPKAVEPPTKKRKGKAKASENRAATPPVTGAVPPSARSLTERVLREAGTPLHIDEIISRIEAAGHTVAKGTLVSMLASYVAKNHTFTRTAPSTFALIAGK